MLVGFLLSYDSGYAGVGVMEEKGQTRMEEV